MLSSLTFTGLFLSTRAEKQNMGFFPEEEVITGVFGRGEGGSDPSGVVEGSGTS